MKKPIVVAFFLFLIIDIGGIVYLNHHKNPPTGKKAAAPVIETASEVPGKKLIIKDREGLETFLSVKEVADLDTGQVIFPKTIKITLSQEKQPRLALYTTGKDGENQQLKSINGYYDKNEDTYFLKVYLNHELLEEAKGELTIDNIVSAYLTEALYYIGNARLNTEGFEEKAGEIQGEIVKNRWEFFGLTDKQSFRWLELIKGFKIVKPALARYCGGTGRGCWYWEQHLHCSDNSAASCSVQGANCNRYYDDFLKKWVWGGTCVWTKPKCEGFLEKACLADGDYCSAAGCGVDSCNEDPAPNCYWVGDVSPTATPTPTPEPQPTSPPSATATCSVSVSPSCTKDGNSVTVSVSGHGDSGTNENVNYWVEQKAPDIGGKINPPPGVEAKWSQYYYFLGSCLSNNAANCTAGKSISLPPGEFVAHCDVPSDPNKCSGNPFCDYESIIPGIVSCPGWKSCSANDNAGITIKSLPSCTGAAPQTPTTLGTSGIFNISAFGVKNATQVKFPTWSDINGQDDIIWYGAPPYTSSVTQNGETWIAGVDLAKHPGLGNISVHVYMDDTSSCGPPVYNQWCGTANFTRLAPAPPTPPTAYTIKGEKVVMPGNKSEAPAIGQTVTMHGHNITVRASGTPSGGVYPKMDLRVRGSTIKTWDVTSVMYDYTYGTEYDINPNDVTVYFTNDANDATGDRNLQVDYISIDGAVYQTENSGVYSWGSWSQGNGCGGGYKSSEWLHCNGYFRYPAAAGPTATTANPYSFSGLVGDRVIEVNDVNYYDVGYSLCNNKTNCHNPSQIVDQKTVGVSYSQVLAGNHPAPYADLFWHYTPETDNVSGTVYDDPWGLSGGIGKCTGPGDPIKPQGGSLVRVIGGADNQTGPVQGGGDYTVNNVAKLGNKTITLENIGSYDCNCPSGCQYSAVNLVAMGATGWNFYVSNIVAKWAQVIAGHVHGQAGVNVSVPSGDVLIDDAAGDGPGVLTHLSGAGVALGSGSLSSQTGWNYDESLAASTWHYSYQSLWERAGRPAGDPGDGSSPPGSGTYRKSGDFTVSGNWKNYNGSATIFVDGSVTVQSEITLFGSGNFLAIIASGDISVDPGVGNTGANRKISPTSSDANLAGVFLANGSFNTGTGGSQNDRQLVIYGSVGADIDLNGGGSVNLQRDMGPANIAPGTAFIWNPNLLLSVPDQLQDALTDWREVAP